MQPALIGSTMRALSTASVHDEFVDSWKDHIKEKVSEYQYFNVGSVRPSVCVCVTDVTSANHRPRMRENTREDRDVIICVHS